MITVIIIAKTLAAALLGEIAQGKSISEQQRREDCDQHVRIPTVHAFERLAGKKIYARDPLQRSEI
jgi:hypothetical protein